MTVLNRCLRRPLLLIAVFIMPVVCLIIDIPFSKTDDITSAKSFRIAVADLDHSPASLALVMRLGNSYKIKNTGSDDINKLLTERKSDWALVIPAGFQEKLLAGEDKLVESYGFVEAQGSIPAKVNVEQTLQAMRMLAAGSDEATLDDQFQAWIKQSVSIPIYNVADHDRAAKPGLGMLLYGMVILYAAFLFTQSLMRDKEEGMTTRIASTPIPPWRYLLEHLSSFSLVLIVQNMLVMAAYQLFFPYGLAYPLLMLVSYIAFSIMSVGFMLTICELCKTSFSMMIASTLMIMLTSMLGGLFLPIDIMPEMLKKIAMLTPTYWFTRSIDSLYANIAAYGSSLIMLVGFTIVFYLVGSWRRYSQMN